MLVSIDPYSIPFVCGRTHYTGCYRVVYKKWGNGWYYLCQKKIWWGWKYIERFRNDSDGGDYHPCFASTEEEIVDILLNEITQGNS